MSEAKQKIRTVGCFLEHQGEFLILKRLPEKSQGDTWGLPAGKVDRGESDLEAIVREVREETGYDIDLKELEHIGEYTWDFPEKIVEFPTFRVRLSQPIDVTHNPSEHVNYAWVTPEECYKKDDLIHGLHDLLERIGYVKQS